MALRAAASRPYAAEVKCVTSKSVALQENVQNVRERRLALEEAMRQERSRRLQQSARKRSTSPRKDARGALQGEQQPQAAGKAAQSSPAELKNANDFSVHGNQLPRDVDEYRRELDSANGNKEVYRLHYYSSGYINPADVHFYKVKGRVREYQRHAPSPLQVHNSPPRSSKHDKDATQLLAITSMSAEGTTEQWTKSALLRMQTNQRALKRMHEREKREAALLASRSAAAAASAQRKQVETGAVDAAAAAAALNAGVPRPPQLSGVTPLREAAPVPQMEPLTALPPTAFTSSTSHDRSWRSDRMQQYPSASLFVSGGTIPTHVPSPRTTAAAPTVSMLWSPLRQQSPRRTYFSSSPLRRYNGGDPQSLHTAQNSPFKPSLTYSPGSLHTSRFAPNPIFTTSASLGEQATTSPWRPLHHGWTSPSRGLAHSEYQPITPQVATAASSTASESRRSWEGLTRRSSPTRFYDTHRPSLFPRPSSAFRADTAATSATRTKEKAEVVVSPLTPTPTTKTASKSTGKDAEDMDQPAAKAAASNPPWQKPSLLDGFRMPEIVLKRDDLFQGTS